MKIIMESFTKLSAWKKGMLLVKGIYQITSTFHNNEQFALTSQIRRSSASILANLAEGFSRRSPPDKSHKYTIARGECSETQALLLIAIELQHVSTETAKPLLDLCEETGKMLTGLIHTYQKPTPYTYS